MEMMKRQNVHTYADVALNPNSKYFRRNNHLYVLCSLYPKIFSFYIQDFSTYRL